MYYLKYNGIDLTQLVKVRDISLPSLPEIEHSAIDMWEMDGNLFGSLSYGNKTIKITAIIQPLNPDDLTQYVNDVKRAFFVKEPKPLYILDETKYLLAVPEGEVTIAELGKGTCELSATLIAYYPYWIKKEVQSANFEGFEGTIVNNGDVPTTPIMSVAFHNNACFVQLEKKNTKERILLGEIPREQKERVEANSNILFDLCRSLSSWTKSSAGLDPGCSTGGEMAVTSSGAGFCLSTVGNSQGQWKGAAYRQNLGQPVKDFKVRVNITFDSVGDNGDPTVIENVVRDEAFGDNVTGDTAYEHMVDAQSTPVRTGAGTNYPCIGTYLYGDIIVGGQYVNGWLEHTYKGGKVYVSTEDIKTYCVDSRQGDDVGYYVVNQTIPLRSAPRNDATSLASIPAGTILRCYNQEEVSGFRKLFQTFNGKKGYIISEALSESKEASYTVKYELEGERADDKEGIIQLYGFSADGTQLFSLSVIDDSEWYEATYPLIKKNGADFLYEEKYVEPAAKTRAEMSNDGTVKYEKILGNRLGIWNEFKGDLYIERIQDQWYAYIRNTNNKFIESSRTTDTANSNLNLAYVVIYAGVANPEKMSCMSINEIQIQTANEINNETEVGFSFQINDVLEIDCGIPCVRVNGVERNGLVDIGSQFFDLDVGENEIVIASDAAKINFGAMYNEKYL